MVKLFGIKRAVSLLIICLYGSLGSYGTLAFRTGPSKMAQSRRLTAEMWLTEDELGPVVGSKCSPWDVKQDYVLPPFNRKLGTVYQGNPARIRRFLRKLTSGQRTVIAAVGGSITEGACTDLRVGLDPYHLRLQKMLRATFQNNNTFAINGGVSGTNPAFMEQCLQSHAPSDADVIVIEYAVNDYPAHPNPFMANAHRRIMERFVRRALNFPNRPAVIFLNNYIYEPPVKGYYYNDPQPEYLELATYYNVPMVSVKAAAHHLLRANTTNFMRASDPLFASSAFAMALNTPDLFYCDRVHPGPNGHRVMAELLFNMMNDTLKDMQAHPRAYSATEDDAVALQALPEIMIEGNHEPGHNGCFFTDSFKQLAVTPFEPQGWKWVDEGKPPRHKWGFVSTTVGSVLRLTFDIETMAPKNLSSGLEVFFSMLTSYEHMGMASIGCEQGCTCKEVLFNAHVRQRVSLAVFSRVAVKPIDRTCTMKIKVHERTDSKEHKIKVLGVTLSSPSKEAKADIAPDQWRLYVG